MRPEEIIQRPLVTEKGTQLRENTNEYLFAVHPKAGKPAIRLAVEKLFGVKVVAVRTLHVRGKHKRHGKGIFKRPDWKKAIVRLKEKETIKMFEGK